MSAPASTSRVERRKQELRREIIAAAFDCFTEKGYHATGIADIAARLGIGHGTFYRYFANKRDIVEHVVDDVVARIVTALGADNAPAAADTLADYRDQGARIGDALGHILIDDPRLPRIVLEAPGIDPEMSNKVMEFFDLARALNAQYIAHGIATGYLRADLDVEATADAIIGMIMAAILAAARRPDRDHQRRLAETIQTIMFDGIRA
ncbi:MAG: TetR/AcrR family transcriptional regulator [Actinomycetota bacterium]|nr:TetR/AcrR family transcriptional regulator [Actinomycetota bacterium]